jgi:glycerol-3-phosphate dehydrogenase
LEDLRTASLLVVKARSVVNATGPWSDKMPNSETSLRLTKGVHLVIDRSRLPMEDAVVLAEGSRILFVIPWGERVILGTTDTDYRGPLENPSCDAEDVSYVLQVVNEAFPTAKLTPNDLVSTWSGLRPLVADKNGNPSDISRRHKIAMSHAGWWDVTGGKLTTYRLMGEETVDAIVRFLGVSAGPCRTATIPLLEHGPQGENGHAESFSGILPPPVSAAAVSRYCRVEAARHLDDVMIRRSSWRHYHHNHLELAANVARWMAAELGWTDAETETELQRYRRLIGAMELQSPIVIGAKHRGFEQDSHQSTVCS